MTLPTTAAAEDSGTICTFLANKPAGATNADALAVPGGGAKGKRKSAACRHSGFIEKDENGMTKITDRESRAIPEEAEGKANAFSRATSDYAAYRAVIDDAARQGSATIAAPGVVSFWQRRLPSEVSKAKTEHRHQSGCLFRMPEGAGPGEMTVGKPGQKTLIDFHEEKAKGIQEYSKDHLPLPVPLKKTVGQDEKAEAPQGEVSGAESWMEPR